MAKNKENISYYSHFTLVCTMTKPKSPCTVKILIDENDFLVYVTKYKTKSGDISEQSIVLKTDIPRWIEIYEKEGFIKNNT